VSHLKKFYQNQKSKIKSKMYINLERIDKNLEEAERTIKGKVKF
jgi:hypothetical protein